MKKLLPIIAILFSVSAFSQTGTPTPSNKPRVHRYVDTSRPAQNIKSEYPYDIKIQNAEGDTLFSNDIFSENKKPTVLLFWLTTCGPCRLEMKAISQKYKAWQSEEDFNFYAISIDFPRNYPAFQKKVAENNWPFPAYHDVNREFRKVMPGELNGLPQVFILDKNGEIAYHKRKYSPGDEDKLFEKIKEL